MNMLSGRNTEANRVGIDTKVGALVVVDVVVCEACEA